MLGNPAEIPLHGVGVALGLAAWLALSGCGAQDEVAVESPPPVQELRVQDIVVGDGAECRSPSEIVTIHYRGMLLDGKVFDSSFARDTPIVARLDSLIPGWQQGMPGMRVGGVRRLTVPQDLAYSGMAAVQAVGGNRSSAAGEILIPPGSTLVFEIELLAVGSSENAGEPSDIARSEGD